MELVELGSLLTIAKGKKPPTSAKEKLAGYLPYVDIQAFETGKIDNYTSGEKCLPCEEGDLLIVCDGSRSGLVGRAIRGYVGSTLAKVTSSELDDQYLFYFIQSKYTLLNTNKKGTGTPHLNQELLKQQKLPVPPLSEQRRIVARIEELISTLDEGVNALLKIKEQLKVYRQAVLKDAFDKVGVERIPLSSIIEQPRYGTSKKCSYDKGNNSVGVFRIPNIDYLKGIIDHSDLKYACFTADELEKITLNKNDLLMIRSNGSVSLVGRTAIISEDDIYSTYAGYLIRLRLKCPDRATASFLHYFLESHEARVYIETVARSTNGVNNINADEIKSIRIPQRDSLLIQSIVEEIEGKLSLWENVSKEVELLLLQAEALRQSILKQAFGGGL